MQLKFKMKILKQDKSKILPRIDVVATFDHVEKRTPSVNEVKEELSKAMKVDKDLIVVDHIYSGFGTGFSEVVAYVYDNKESMEKIIKKTKKQKEAEKKALEEAKKKAAEEAKAAEAPKEENGKEEEKEQSTE